MKVWPLLDGDAPATFPAAVEISEGRPLKTPVWLSPYPSTLEPFKENRFVGHGFVYQMVVGGIGWLFGGGARATVAGMYLLNLAASYLVGRGLLLWAPETLRRSIWCGVVFGISVFSFCLAWAGRMEPGVFFLVGLVLLAGKIEGNKKWFFLGGLAALLGLVSPAYGIGGAFLLGIHICLNPTGSFLGRVLYATGGSASAIILCFLFYPYPVSDWIAGILQSGQGVLGTRSGQGFFSTWLKNYQLPALVAVFGVPAIGALVCTLKKIQKEKSIAFPARLFAAIFLFLFVLVLFRLALLKTEAAYNAIGYIPLCLAILYASINKRVILIAVTSLLLFPVIGSVRSSIVLANQYRASAVSFAEVQATISEKMEEGIMVAPAFFLACKDPWGVEFDDLRQREGPKPLWFIDKQVNRGVAEPRAIAGYELIKNRFGSAIKLIGFPVSRTPGGWEYAVYRRVD